MTRYPQAGSIPGKADLSDRHLIANSWAVRQMQTLLDYPLLIFAASLVVLWASAHIGGIFHKQSHSLDESDRNDLGNVLSATLTLLGLIIGFSFSMAISRYDQRKNYEEEEANAIGTEQCRADLLPDAAAKQVRELLKQYIHQRVLFYETRDEHRLHLIGDATTRLQTEMWSTVQFATKDSPSPVVALVVSGMNDVLNSQGYTHAAWLNRLPTAAWSLMITIAIFCNILIGYSAHHRKLLLFLILPIILSISFFLIADIDSPRGGLILVQPRNLQALLDNH